MLAASLAISNWLVTARPPTLLLALAVVGILGEGAQNTYFYFGKYAASVRRDRPFQDRNVGEALQIVARERRDSEPLYLPGAFIDTYGTYLEFYLDLDPVRRRKGSLADLGIYDVGSVVPDGGVPLRGTAQYPRARGAGRPDRLDVGSPCGRSAMADLPDSTLSLDCELGRMEGVETGNLSPSGSGKADAPMSGFGPLRNLCTIAWRRGDCRRS